MFEHNFKVGDKVRVFQHPFKANWPGGAEERKDKIVFTREIITIVETHQYGEQHIICKVPSAGDGRYTFPWQCLKLAKQNLVLIKRNKNV